MNKSKFIKYYAQRYGVDESTSETMVDMFADCLQDLLKAGQSVEIDEIGKFKSIPLFPEGLNHRNNIALARLSRSNMVSFAPSKQLINSVEIA